jgi:hypothetical protein
MLRHTKHIDQRNKLQTIKRELQIVETPTRSMPTCKQPVTAYKELSQIDICAIRAIGFHRNFKQPRTKTFTTSLYKINCLLKEKMSLTDKDLMDK